MVPFLLYYKPRLTQADKTDRKEKGRKCISYKEKRRGFLPVSSEKIQKTASGIFPSVKKVKRVALHKNDEAIRPFPRVIHIFHRVFHRVRPEQPLFFMKMWKTSFVLPNFHSCPVEN